MYIDIHTHHQTQNNHSIRNIVAGNDQIPDWDSNLSYSIGIHPWYLSNFDSLMKSIEKYSKLNVIKAIGETGLDKNSSFTYTLQIEVFKRQAILAETLNKPLIIHCVKSFNELIRIKNELKPNIPWILHGFNAPENILLQCIQKGFYFSVGHQLFNTKTHIYKLVGIIPRERIFLETDESTVPIHEIYAQYAFITGIPEPDVNQMIYTNFVYCFKNNL